uniref:ISXO2-like transposase domain-containing protein n=1 Tax=Octopus bimaculoides TaxID=37653 RepID=A0A0L8I1U8_OCTBM
MTSAYPSVNGINHHDIAIATATTADSINWFKIHGLLNTPKICTSKGTFLENSNLKCEQIIDILYCAKEDLAKGISQECCIANVAVTDWRNFCHGICAEYYVAQNIKLGGPNRIVEIDESAFVRRKYNVGHQVKTQWVFGALERDTRCFLVAVEDRSADTLLEIIDLTVNHSINFVDLVTFATTNHIECLWKHVKNRNKRENGTAQNLLQSHLIEFMWRYEFKDEIFGKLLEQIRHLYPCI